MGKAGKYVQRGIDPGFAHFKGGNPLRDTGMVAGVSQPLGCLGAYLICSWRAAATGQGVVVQSNGLLLTPEHSPLPLAPCGRWAPRQQWGGGMSTAIAVSPLPLGERRRVSNGVRERPGRPELHFFSTLPNVRWYCFVTTQHDEHGKKLTSICSRTEIIC